MFPRANDVNIESFVSHEDYIIRKRRFPGPVFRRFKVENCEIEITFELFCCFNLFCNTSSLTFTAISKLTTFGGPGKLVDNCFLIFLRLCILIIRRSQKLYLLTTSLDNPTKLNLYVVLISKKEAPVCLFFPLKLNLIEFLRNSFFAVEY